VPHGPLTSADSSRIQRIRRLLGAVITPEEDRIVRAKPTVAAASAIEAVWRCILDRSPAAAEHARACEREQTARVAEGVFVARARLLFDAHYKGGETAAGGGSKHAPGVQRGRWDIAAEGKAGSWADELYKLCESEVSMAGKAAQLERAPSSLLQMRAEALKYLPSRLLRRHAAAAMATFAGVASDLVTVGGGVGAAEAPV
jgi:hypothetical protein